MGIVFLIALVVTVLGGTWWMHHRHVAQLQAQNFAWYKKQHPEHVTPRGAKCYSCNSPRVGTERLMQQTYTRRHFCRDCGTTLYYSPED